MSVLSSVLNIAIRDEIINTNPLSKIKRVQWKEPELKFLTVEEVRKLHESHCKYPEIKRAFLFSCFTGLRLSDIENLKWDQIYNDREKLYVQLVQKKTTEPVRIYLAKQAAEYLDEQNRGDVYVFMLLDRRHTQRKLKEWLQSVQGIKSNISFHSARHTFATMTLTYGAGLKTVSELLGHKSIKVTERYAKVIDKLKEEAVNNLPDF